MFQISMRNQWSSFTTALPENVRTYVKDTLSWEDPSAIFIARRFGGFAQSKRTLIQRDGRFPTGLLPILRKRLREDLGIEVQIVDDREQKGLADPQVDLRWLVSDPKYSFQLDLVNKGLSRRRGIFWVPTGGGKTECAIALAQAVQGPWVFLVQGTDLMYQAAERYEERTGERAGVIGDGLWVQERFTVATFQTLWAAIKKRDAKSREVLRWLANDLVGMFVDEVHELPADSFYKVAMKTGAFWRFGLSGTPLARGDKKSVYAMAALGPVIYRITAQELIDLGVLSRPKIRMISCEQYTEAKHWQYVEADLITNSHRRNTLVVEMAMRAHKPCLVFTTKVKHAKLLCAALNHVGVRSALVSGEKATPARDRAVHNLRHGDLDAIVSTKVFQTGKNIPELRSLVIATGGKSSIAAIQRIGRGTRRAEGKDSFEVWDVMDRGQKSLTRQAQARARAYRSEGYEVELVERLEGVGRTRGRRGTG